MKTKKESKKTRLSTAGGTDTPALPAVVDRATFQAKLDVLRVREKAHTHEGDAIAAARRRLPMVAVDGATPLIGKRGTVTLLDGTATSWAGRCPGIRRKTRWTPSLMDAG
jgi:hypothetical protein